MTAPAWSAVLELRAVEVCAKMEVGGDDNEEEFMDKGPGLLRCALAEIERLRGVLSSACSRMEADRLALCEMQKAIGVAAEYVRTSEARCLELERKVLKLENEITDYALTRVTGRLGPTNAEIDAADNAAGRRRARRKK